MGISYKEFISSGMRMMNLKGATATVIREAMRELAKEWVRRKVTNAVNRDTARQVADKLLGGK